MLLAHRPAAFFISQTNHPIFLFLLTLVLLSAFCPSRPVQVINLIKATDLCMLSITLLFRLMVKSCGQKISRRASPSSPPSFPATASILPDYQRRQIFFWSNRIDVSWHKIIAKGVLPLPEKVSAIKQFPKPSVTQLRQFLGLINFYHRFIPNCAHLLHPLHLFLNNLPKSRSKQTLPWTEETSTAFQDVEDALASATFLSYPHPNAPINLMVDASNTAVGAVLQQQVNDDWQPISFFSRSLSPRERKYSTFDRALLATFLAVKNFQHHLHQMTRTISGTPIFTFLPITNHSSMPSTHSTHITHHTKHVSWVIFPSLQRIFDTFMAWGTESCRRCPFTYAG